MPGRNLWLFGTATFFLATLSASAADLDEAVNALEKMGASINRASKPAEHPVTSVDLDGTKATDDDMALVQRMTTLQGLFLSDTAVSDAGLARLTGQTELMILDLEGTKVTDAGLVYLPGLTRRTFYSCRGRGLPGRVSAVYPG